MRAFGYMMVTLMLAIAAWTMPARAQDAIDQPGPHLRIALVAESDTPKAGGEVAIALDTKPQPGWHGYWQKMKPKGTVSLLRTAFSAWTATSRLCRNW